jgi:hypothetical protein
MRFAFDIASLSVVGLDFGNSSNDGEEMTLTAYNAAGNQIGQQHFTVQSVEAAIPGSIAFPGTRFVSFNYTNTQFGFYGIDNLEFERADGVPEPSTFFLIGAGLLGLGVWRRRRT